MNRNSKKDKILFIEKVEIDLHRPAGFNLPTNVVIWQNSGPSGALSVHVLNVDRTNTFTYNATSSEIFVQIRQAGTYYLDNIRMYRTYEDTVFVRGYEVDMAYRYSFQGQEHDDEIKGKGNSYDFGARIYDPRLGRFLSLDRFARDFPSESSYIFSGNSPIIFKDLNGDFKIKITEEAKKKRSYRDKNAKVYLYT